MFPQARCCQRGSHRAHSREPFQLKMCQGASMSSARGAPDDLKKNKRKKERNRFNEPTDVEMTHSGSSLLISLKQAYHRSK